MSEPKFKLGDRVVSLEGLWPGAGTVTEYLSPNHRVGVTAGEEWSCPHNTIALAPEGTPDCPPMPKFKRGDQVVVIGSGRVGIVDGGDGFGQYCVEFSLDEHAEYTAYQIQLTPDQPGEVVDNYGPLWRYLRLTVEAPEGMADTDVPSWLRGIIEESRRRFVEIANLRAEAERLRDAARIAWCLSVGVIQRDARIGRREGSRTWMINVGNDPSDPGFGPWRFCHLAASDDESCQYRMTMPGDYDCRLGPHFDINGAADPDRVRAIIDQAMQEATPTARKAAPDADPS